MKVENIILLLVVVAVGVTMWCFVLRQWPCEPAREPIVEDYDEIWKPDSGLSPLPKELNALPRPLAEYPNAAFTHPLIEPFELKATAFPRPLIEYSNSATSFVLGKPQTSPATLPRPLVEYSDGVLTMVLAGLQPSPAVEPRPLVEYADSAIVFALDQPSQDLNSSAAQAEPCPLVEYADAGWSGSLSPPLGLLKEEE